MEKPPGIILEDFPFLIIRNIHLFHRTYCLANIICTEFTAKRHIGSKYNMVGAKKIITAHQYRGAAPDRGVAEHHLVIFYWSLRKMPVVVMRTVGIYFSHALML